MVGVDQNGLPYRAADFEASFVHYASTQATTPLTASDAHATALIPQGPAPAMLLVMIFKETMTPDGGLSVDVDRSCLICPPAPASLRAQSPTAGRRPRAAGAGARLGCRR